MKLLAVLASTALALSAAPALAAHTAPQTAPAASSAISTSYAKRAIRRFINRKYDVALGPYFGACQKLASNSVRCEVQFKAGLYWRCGRVSVRNSGAYDYINARLPIGC
jgi:hypothetical protein